MVFVEQVSPRMQRIGQDVQLIAENLNLLIVEHANARKVTVLFIKLYLFDAQPIPVPLLGARGQRENATNRMVLD
jgi:hypothetical protein